jgi:hypothetical protein
MVWSFPALLTVLAVATVADLLWGGFVLRLGEITLVAEGVIAVVWVVGAVAIAWERTVRVRGSRSASA